MVFTESFTAEVMCRFLDRLAGHFDHKVHLVVDGHSAHRSKKVRDWLAAHPDAVELHFLPPYSPELNPVASGLLRKDMPATWLASTFCGLAETAWELTLEGHMAPDRLRTSSPRSCCAARLVDRLPL